MRIVITTPYDLAVPGGVNRHAVGLLRELNNRGNEALLVGPSSRRLPDDPSIMTLGGVRTGRLNGATSRVTLDLTLGPAMRTLFRRFRPQVVHLQEPFLPTLNTFALLCAGNARCVGTFHTYSETSRGYLYSWPWCDWVNGRLHARVAPSQAAGEFVRQFHPAAVALVRHATRVPEAERRPSGPPSSPFRVLFVGRGDEPRKGFRVLQEAMRQVDREAPGRVVLQTAGPGTPGGEKTDQDLSACYRSSDLCVVPSIGGESFGLVALEALAHGVPVIASRIPGYAEWLDGSDAAQLVPPDAPETLAQVLLSVSRESDGRYAERAAEALRLAGRYGWSESVEMLEKIYRGEAV